MRPSLRFLALAVIGWAGVRAATLGVLPGAEVFRIDRSEAKPPPIIPTQFPPIEPIEAATPGIASADYLSASAPIVQVQPAYSRPIVIPVYYPSYAGSDLRPASNRLSNAIPDPAPQFYSPIPILDEWPLSRIAATSLPPLRSSVAAPGVSLPAQLKRTAIDRLQLAAWALLRGQQGAILAPTSLANGGSLGGSQGGIRLTYNFTRQIAAAFRTTSEVGRRGGEVAAGMRVQPLASAPLWLTAERRQRIGRDGDGRNAFALFFETALYGRSLPARFTLDAYLQGGVVGFRSRDKFVDGAVTVTKPVYRQFSAGLGLWGGAQPGVYRVDAGPRVTMHVRNNLKVHLDWRQRLAGNAAPGSGPAITLAGDF